MTTIITIFLAILAAVTTMIAYYQWRTQRLAVQLSLYDRRYKVYDAVMALISSAMQEGETTEAAIDEYKIQLGQVRWLFDDKMFKYIHDDVFQKLVDLRTKNRELRTKVSEQRHAKLCEEITDLQKWAGLAWYEVIDRFKPYMWLK